MHHPRCLGLFSLVLWTGCQPTPPVGPTPTTREANTDPTHHLELGVVDTVQVPEPEPEPSNLAPTVTAGPDLEVLLTAESVTVGGVATDDGLPDGTLAPTWSLQSGPDSLELVDPHALETEARFAEAGDYVLQVVVDDGELQASDTLVLRVVEPVPVTPGEVVRVQVPSASKGIDVETAIYIPPGYADSTDDVAVLYHLHGSGGGTNSLTDAYGALDIEGSDAADKLNQLMAAGSIRPMLIVAPWDHGDRWRSDDVEALAGSETFLMDELPAYLRAHYRVPSDRWGWAMEGFSLGGDASTYYLAKYSSQWVAAAQFSAYTVTYNVPASPSVWEDNVESLTGQPHYGIRIVPGEDEGWMFAITGTGALLDHLDGLSIDYTYDPVSGVGHQLGPLYAARGVETLQFISDTMDAAEDL